MRTAALLLCLTLTTSIAAEDVRSVSRAAVEAYQAKDWKAYLTSAKKLDVLRPNHPRVLYNLAGAYALNGDAGAALSTIARVAAMGLVYPAATDEDFASLRDDDRYTSVLATFEKNGRETGNASPAFTIDEVRGAIPEGVARDPKSGTAWVGLVRDPAILQIGADGKASRLEIPEPLWSVTGLVFNAASGTLWFCTAATEMMRVKDDEAAGNSSVLAWNVAESKLVGRWDLTAGDAPHWLGDLTLTPDGTVYATDSRTPAIYRIRKGAETIERWLTSDAFVSLQGLTWNEDARRLYVADYVRGIFSIDTTSGAVSLLSTPADATVLGIDGLYHHEGNLIGIQNGTNPHRIIRIHLDDAGGTIERVETLEANRPLFDEPTLGVVQNGWFWFVATSQWGAFTDDGQLKEGAEEKPVVVMKRKLEDRSAGCGVR
jgi:DNA-binding beta-propeller fold protein YncE